MRGTGDGHAAFFAGSGDGDFLVLYDDFLANRGVVVLVVVVVKDGGAVDGVGDALGNTLDTATEGVILTLVVVIAHITLVLRSVDGCSSSALYSNFFGGLGSRELSCETTETGACVFVEVTGGSTADGDGVLTELAFGSVEGLLKGWSSTTDDTALLVVDAFLGVGVVLYVELSVGVAGEGLRVAATVATLEIVTCRC